MSRHTWRFGLLVGMSVLISTAMVSGNSEKAKPPPEEIQQLIDELGNDDPKVREAATRKLAQREDALPALRKALRSEDPEVRRRAEAIITEIQNRLRDRAVQRILDKGIDLFIDELVVRGKGMDEDTWLAVVDLSKSMASKAGRAQGMEIALREWDFMTCESQVVDHWRSKSMLVEAKLLANSASSKLIHKSVVVCRGTVRADIDFMNSVIFANGDIKPERSEGFLTIRNCVVFCDGDVFAGHIDESVVIATGNVVVEGVSSIRCSVVISQGYVKTGTIAGSVVMCRGGVGRVGGNGDERTWLQEGSVLVCPHEVKTKTADFRGPASKTIKEDPFPHPFMKLFNPATAGIEVADSKTEAKVEKVHNNKPFAKAGFQKGDLVLAVGDKEVKSYDDFRKAVRRNFVDKTEPVFKVKRGEQTLELKVSFKE